MSETDERIPAHMQDLPQSDGKSSRVYGIIARSAHRAILFRRGPSRSTRLLSWDLKSDTIEAGQWVRARIYERRCDLSPDGKYLVYFAANYKPPLDSWTAISRPPWFTALALWRKDDGWGGGGLFDSSVRLRLNHRPQPYRDDIDEWSLQEGFTLPKWLTVEPLHEHSGWGEDDPIEYMRLLRDGWRFEDNGSVDTEHNFQSRYWVTFDPPRARSKPLGKSRNDAPLLRVQLHGIKERQGRWLVETADVVDAGGAALHSLGRIDWADVDHQGDVLYASEGRLVRLRINRARDGLTFESRLIADLNDMKFKPIRSPSSAKSWK